MSTLSPSQEALVAVAIERALTGRASSVTEPIAMGSPVGATSAGVRRSPSPKTYTQCDYCGAVGQGHVCRNCADLPGLDSLRAPELYGR